MKKSIALLLCLAMIFTAGCSSTNDSIIETPLETLSESGAEEANNTDTNNDQEDSTQEESTNTQNSEHTLSEEDKPTGEMVEIKEKMFIAQTNDIYYNYEDYLGKTIKYEGIYNTYFYENNETTYYYVTRYGPGCCGTDSDAGFEITWDGEMPEEDDWVEVVGVLEMYEEFGATFLRLKVTSITVLDERGEEYVYQ